MTIFSPVLRRFAALAILAGLLGSLWILVVQPIVMALDGADRALDERRALLASSQRTAADEPRLRAERDTMVATLEDGGGFLTGDSLALIAARLQDRIKQLVARHGGTVDSLQTLPSRRQEAFGKVSVRATMTVDTPGPAADPACRRGGAAGAAGGASGN